MLPSHLSAFDKMFLGKVMFYDLEPRFPKFTKVDFINIL